RWRGHRRGRARSRGACAALIHRTLPSRPPRDGRGARHRLTDYVRSIEERRAREQEALHRFPSVLFAVDRRALPLGAEVVLHGVRIVATADGFLVDDEPSGPRIVDAGRYGLRLSHQGYPAAVVLDREATPRGATLRWYPVDPSLRISGGLEEDTAPLALS